LGSLVGIILLMLAANFSFIAPASADDFLYIGDGGDDTVKRFNARTGAYLGEFVTQGSGALNGPRGLIFAQGRLFLANQNVDQNFAGEILRFRRDTGVFLNALVPCNPPFNRPDPINGIVECGNAPFAPRGMIRGPGRTLFVADHDGARVAKYNLDSGAFLGNLDASSFSGVNGVPGLYFPRGIVRGPDDLLYVSVTALPTGIAGSSITGYVLRFNAQTGRFVDVFTSNLAPGCAAHLHRPEGLVFGPDNKLYVTAFRADENDNDKILIFNRNGSCVDQINLDQVGQPRTFAQALLFGPKDRLFVPINNTGEVRSYNVKVKPFGYDVFITPGGHLLTPWYMTFGETNPSTLEY
jgi:DNA-binding beta-propeller fold protein YncE